jgi:hypothetical protein
MEIDCDDATVWGVQRGRLIAVALAAAVSAFGAFAPPAAADAFERVYNDFKKTGRIPPCKYSSAELQDAAQQVPPDIEQYVPSFLDALDAARDNRADCGKKKPAAQAVPPPAPAGAPPAAGPPQPASARGAPTGAPPAPPASAQPRAEGLPSPAVSGKDKRDAGTPAPVWLLAGLGVLAVLAAISGAIAWWLGWSPAWLASLKASFTEAGERIADTGFEFLDWVRTGR